MSAASCKPRAATLPAGSGDSPAGGRPTRTRWRARAPAVTLRRQHDTTSGRSWWRGRGELLQCLELAAELGELGGEARLGGVRRLEQRLRPREPRLRLGDARGGFLGERAIAAGVGDAEVVLVDLDVVGVNVDILLRDV